MSFEILGFDAAGILRGRALQGYCSVWALHGYSMVGRHTLWVRAKTEGVDIDVLK